jgi:hypothetical protein
MKMNLQWAQLHSGKSTQILATKQNLEFCQHNWFMEIKLFLNKSNAKILIKNAWTPTKHRKNDFILMDMLENYTRDKKLQNIINNWRMYYNVLNLSDITNYAGDTILPQFIYKKFVMTYKSQTRIRWPIQEHPGLHTFNIWCNFIRSITSCNTNGTIKEKLGDWLVHPMSVQKIRTWINDYSVHKK